MIENIDAKIQVLLKYRDMEKIVKIPELRATICSVIEKAYFLQYSILMNRSFSERRGEYFFTAESAANRHFRDFGLNEVADIYNELCKIAKPYLTKKKRWYNW